jgi:hypothetical protein
MHFWGINAELLQQDQRTGPATAGPVALCHERRASRARRKEEERAEAFFPLFDCSLPLADRARKPPPLSSLADERRVGSLLRSMAARDPVRATTTAADSEHALWEPLEYIAWKFRDKSARVVEESAFAAYCLCVT